MHMELQSEPITVGCQVEFEFQYQAGNKERMKIVLVADHLADFSRGFLGESTPLAKILIGERQGSVIPYFKDDILSIEILEVTKPLDQPTEDVAKKREAAMNKALREVEATNAMVFASSFSGK